MRLFNTTWFYYLNGNANDDETAIEITSDMEGFRIRDDFVLEIESRIIRNSMFLYCKREYIGHIMQSGTVILTCFFKPLYSLYLIHLTENTKRYINVIICTRQYPQDIRLFGTFRVF